MVLMLAELVLLDKEKMEEQQVPLEIMARVEEEDLLVREETEHLLLVELVELEQLAALVEHQQLIVEEEEDLHMQEEHLGPEDLEEELLGLDLVAHQQQQQILVVAVEEEKELMALVALEGPGLLLLDILQLN